MTPSTAETIYHVGLAGFLEYARANSSYELA